jgi:amino acid adenylation domain-containing protein
MTASSSPETIEGFRLSAQQAAMWLAGRGRPEGRICCTTSIIGPPDEAALHAALETLVADHDVLRTRVCGLPGMTLPLQVVGGDAAVPWRTAGPPAAANAVIEQERTAPIDVERGPVLRAALVRGGPDQPSVLHLELSEMVADLRTAALLVGLLAERYRAGARDGGTRVRGENGRGEDGRAEAGVSYVQFAEWQQEMLADDAAREGVGYWRNYLTAAPADPPLSMLAAGPAAGPPGPESGANRPPRTLGADRVAGLDALAARLHTTPEAVLLTVWGGLLSRLTGRRDLVVAAALDGRRFEEVQRVPGPFATSLPVRVTTARGQRFDAAARHIGEVMAAHQDHQDFAGVAAAEMTAAGSQAPWRPGAGFDYLDYPAVFQAGSTTFRIDELEHRPHHAAVHLSCRRTAAALSLRLACDPQVVAPADAERLMGCFLALLESAIDRPGSAVDSLRAVTPAQRLELLAVSQGPDRPPPAAFFPELFERQVTAGAHRIAARSGDAALTYAQLAAWADAVTRRLRAAGVRAGDPVALVAQPSLPALAAIIAILKSGAVYVPVDPADPTARRAAILAEVGVAAVVTTGDAGDRAAGAGVPVLTVTPDDALAPPPGPTEPGARPGGGDAAYIMHTSGSTGPPKGVLVEHRALANYLRWVNEALVGDLDVPAVTRLTFDASLKQLLAPLTRGGEVWLVPERVAGEPAELCRALCARAAGGTPTGINCVPSLWQAMLDVIESAPDARLRPPLRRVMLGGEPLPADLVRRTAAVLPDAEIWNLYGPTEATVNALAGRVLPGGPAPIGRPVDNTQAFLLDDDLEPVPVGAPGRLYIGGLGLARAYPGNPRETAARFVPSPFPRGPGERLYDTGDVARYLADGRIDYLGRRDLQVKIRGFRIEIEGVEAALRGLPGVRDAAVSVLERPGAPKMLVGFVAAAPGATVSLSQVRARLAQTLPAYAVPARLVELNRLPFSSTGKLDRAALAGLDTGADGARETPPAGPTIIEREMAGLWERLLGCTGIGADQSFFELGGQSLLAVRLIARVRDAFGVDLPPDSLFHAPTLRAFTLLADQALARGDAARLPDIGPVPRNGSLALSFGQQRLLILDRLEPGNPRYNVVAARRIVGTVDAAAVASSLKEIVRRHEVLRTSFLVSGGRPALSIRDRAEVPLTVADLRHIAGPERERAAARHMDGQIRRPFDLGAVPPLRASLIVLADDEAVLLIVVHHIACDGWAKSVLFSEFAVLYGAALGAAAPPLPEPALQYADFAAWERRVVSGKLLEDQLAYWRQQLDGIRPLVLPTDRPRPAAAGHRGRTVSRTVPAEVTAVLRELSARHGTTLFMTMLAAFNVLLARWSGQQDIVVGTPVAGRKHAALENMIGFFVNTVALRCDLSGDPTFAALLRRVRGTAVAAYAHQDVPFEKLVEELRPARNRSTAPVFQVMFVFVPPAQPQIGAGDAAVLRPVAYDAGLALFDLTLSASDDPGGLGLHLNVDADLFEPATAERMLTELAELLSGVAADPERRLSELAPSAPLAAAASVYADPVHADPVHIKISGHARSAPNAPAVICGERTLTYRELDTQANRLARYLREHGAGPGTLVGVYLERSADLVVTLLAVLKSGAAYLPLDPGYPSQRTRLVLTDAAPSVLVTAAALAGAVAGLVPVTVWVDTESRAIAARPAIPPDGRARDPDEAAYVIYTSGSTGAPKGVVVTRANLAQSTAARFRFYRDAPARFLLLSSAAFDSSVAGLFWTLSAGGCLVLPAPGAERDARELAGLVASTGVTHLLCVPSLYSALLELAAGGQLDSVRVAIVAGESVPAGLPRQHHELLPQADLFNEYGVTECGVWSAVHECLPDGGRPGAVPIGRPIGGTRLYVLDDEMRPVAAGAEGELWIGGAGVARGYLRRPGLSAGRFRPDPFCGRPGERLYRTGDRARYEPDGNLVLLGRADNQVKLRGFRVELEEIEAAAREYGPVLEVAAALGHDQESGPFLGVHVAARPGQQADAAALREELRGRLPEYMVPVAYAQLAELPRLPNGKVDRRALPPLSLANHGFRGRLEAPQDGLEARMAEIWAELFGLPSVGINDNFFDLGGHSLLALYLLSLVESAFGVAPPLSSLFDAPTVAAFVACVESQLREPGGQPH